MIHKMVMNQIQPKDVENSVAVVRVSRNQNITNANTMKKILLLIILGIIFLGNVYAVENKINEFDYVDDISE